VDRVADLAAGTAEAMGEATATAEAMATATAIDPAFSWERDVTKWPIIDALAVWTHSGAVYFVPTDRFRSSEVKLVAAALN
jgi:hypothetical protein